MNGERIAELLDALSGDERGVARELVRLVLELHGQALSALMALAAHDSDLVGRIGRDERIGSVLLLHGLHPEPAEMRVSRALRGLPGVAVQRIGLDKGVLRLEVRCTAPLRPDEGLRHRIAQVVAAAAPELEGFEMSGLPAEKRVIPIIAAER